MKKVKLLTPHVENCSALKWYEDGQWDSPWFIRDPGQVERLGADGTRRGSNKRWVMAICNSTKCEARAIVRLDALEVLMQKELENDQN